MSTFILFSFAVIAPTVFGLPVPQFGVGSATMGGLTSSITTEDGGFSFAGPPQSNYKNPSNNNGGGYGYQGGETSTTVTVSGPGGITASSSSESYKKTKRNEPGTHSETSPWWITTYLNSKSSKTPVGTAAIGGLTSTITLGGRSA